MNQVKVMISTGKQGQWKQDCPTVTALTPSWDFRDELSVWQDVIVEGQAFLIPMSLRGPYVKLAHNAHQGADACIRRARKVIFWPGMTTDVRAAIIKCETCAKSVPQQQKEPLLQPETSQGA